MTQLNDLEAAEVLLELKQKNLLDAPDKLIYRAFEMALEAKLETGSQEEAPDTQMAEDGATYYQEKIQEAVEMLVDEGVTAERLKQIAEAAYPLVEKQVILMFGVS